MKRFSTIIVGAGPAGLSAARHLKGSVLVIDRKVAIGDNIRCGEVISAHALHREKLPIEAAYVRQRVHRVLRHFPDGIETGRRHREPYGLMLDRPLFEKVLAELSRAAFNFDTHTETIVTEPNGQGYRIETATNTFKCDYLVGADGASSLVRKQIFGEKQRMISAISYSASFDRAVNPDTLHLFFDNKIVPAGYAWLFPIDTRSANLGVLSRGQAATRKNLNYFIDILGLSRGNIRLGSLKSGLIPVGGFHANPAKHNCLLVGDAGGFCDPIFDGGLNLALLTGRLAADSINAAMSETYSEKLATILPAFKKLAWASRWLYGLSNSELSSIHAQNSNVCSGRPGLRGRLSHKRFEEIWGSAKKMLW